MGHINTIGSLDRTALGAKAVGSGSGNMGEKACRSMATLSRLVPYAGEAPPPYDWTLSMSVEEVVRIIGENIINTTNYFYKAIISKSITFCKKSVVTNTFFFF